MSEEFTSSEIYVVSEFYQSHGFYNPILENHCNISYGI